MEPLPTYQKQLIVTEQLHRAHCGESMIHRYTVIGNPVEHSLSPKIHALFAEQTQREIEYTKTLATDADFADIVRKFAAGGGSGCNITIPFKQQVPALCDKLSPAAMLADAVNTIVVQSDGSLTGHNTDGSGLLRDLTQNHRMTLAGADILIAGAGGATRGLLAPLLDQQPKTLVIANRTPAKAIQLADAFSDRGPVVGCDYTDIPTMPFSLIINATSMSLQGGKPSIPEACVGSDTIAYDLMYGQESPFLVWANDTGAAQVIDGLGMLMEQAADAFFLWEDVRPKTRLIMSKL